jgi:phosphatidylinositol alpha-mannosyltransferase
MKIALVSPYDFAYPGGVVNHISALEHYFTGMGHEVKIIAPASRAVADLGDRFIPIGNPRPVPSSGSIARITLSLRLASRIKAVLAEENFDIIHLHEPFVPMLCSAVLRFANTACVGTFHACRGRPSYNFAWPISVVMLKRRARKLTGKIAISKPAMEFASEHVPGYYNIIPNGIDVEHFSPDVAPIERFGNDKLNLLFVGRLESRKGLSYLLKAYKQIKPEIPASRLIIVGPGTRLRRKYKTQVRRDRLEDVIFVGYVPYGELPRYYKTADIYCSPATGSESFGIVLLEAMAMGKPVVASNIEGYASVVTDGVDGLLVPPRDDQALAEVLFSLVTDQSLREQMGARGRDTALKYSWEHIAQRVLDYYTRVLSEPPWRERSRQLEMVSASV